MVKTTKKERKSVKADDSLMYKDMVNTSGRPVPMMSRRRPSPGGRYDRGNKDEVNTPDTRPVNKTPAKKPRTLFGENHPYQKLDILELGAGRVCPYCSSVDLCQCQISEDSSSSSPDRMNILNLSMSNSDRLLSNMARHFSRTQDVDWSNPSNFSAPQVPPRKLSDISENNFVDLKFDIKNGTVECRPLHAKSSRAPAPQFQSHQQQQRAQPSLRVKEQLDALRENVVAQASHWNSINRFKSNIDLDSNMQDSNPSGTDFIDIPNFGLSDAPSADNLAHNSISRHPDLSTGAHAHRHLSMNYYNATANNRLFDPIGRGQSPFEPSQITKVTAPSEASSNQYHYPANNLGNGLTTAADLPSQNFFNPIRKSISQNSFNSLFTSNSTDDFCGWFDEFD